MNEVIAYIKDRIFSRLPRDLSKPWSIRFIESISGGKDLSNVWHKFAIFLLTDKTQCASTHPQCDIVAGKYLAELNGERADWKPEGNSFSYSNYIAYAYASPETRAIACAHYAAAIANIARAHVPYSEKIPVMYGFSGPDDAAEVVVHAANCAFAIARPKHATDYPYSVYSEAYIAQSEKLLELLS